MKTNSLLTDRVVLALNRNWQAIATLTVEQSVLRLVAGAARAMWIDDDNFEPLTWQQWIELPVRPQDPVIGTVRGAIRAPRVILFRRYDKVPMVSPSFGMRGIWERDGGVCQYTGRSLTPSEGNIDHVIPRSRGGANTWENCVLSCKHINRKKAARTPEEAGLTLRSKPREPFSVPSTMRINNVQDIPEWRHFLIA
jgi:5-methylcytosine-specific restriction endonuclease McrA